mmetsp:Transcript_52337/g.131460  ORF Transcript_52337/g.131460 Transcript_52337/m.131460 type:complete len:206 (+) Transcript_52337:750-1367(+)
MPFLPNWLKRKVSRSIVWTNARRSDLAVAILLRRPPLTSHVSSRKVSAESGRLGRLGCWRCASRPRTVSYTLFSTVSDVCPSNPACSMFMPATQFLVTIHWMGLSNQRLVPSQCRVRRDASLESLGEALSRHSTNMLLSMSASVAALAWASSFRAWYHLSRSHDVSKPTGGRSPARPRDRMRVNAASKSWKVICRAPSADSTCRR